jgi:hypothetical protein
MNLEIVFKEQVFTLLNYKWTLLISRNRIHDLNLPVCLHFISTTIPQHKLLDILPSAYDLNTYSF